MSKLVWALAAVIAIFSFVNVGSEAEAVHAPEASRLWKSLSAKPDQLEESEVLLRNRRQIEDLVGGLLGCILSPIRALINGGIAALIQNILGAVVGLVCSLISSIDGLVQGLIGGLPDSGLLGSLKVALGGIVVDLDLQLNGLLQGLGDLIGEITGGAANIVCPNNNTSGGWD